MFRVKLFAAAREIVEQSTIALDLRPPTTVGEVRRALIDGTPLLAPLAARSLIAVNAAYAHDGDVVQLSDDIALIPPVSGG